MAELDMSQYFDLFLQEADEQLEILEQETLNLESDPSLERLQLIFRAAHTLKGSSRAMGFTQFAEVTHEMENLLDQLRGGTRQVSTAVIDILFRCLDTLGGIKSQIAEGNGDTFECADLMKDLQAMNESDAATQDSPAQVTAAMPAPETPGATTSASFEIPSEIDELLQQASKEAPIYISSFNLSEDCVMKWVRVFMVINVIEQVGEILHCSPDRQALEDEHFELDFHLVFQSKSSIEDLMPRLASVAEITHFEVNPWMPATSQHAGTPPETDARAEVDAPKESAAATQSQQPARKADSGQTVRVDVSRLDELMNLVGELVIDRTRIAQIGTVLAAKYDDDTHVESLAEIVGHISRITSDLQDQIMKARMLPIETVFNRFPRMMRDLAHKIGKDIRFETFGGETELDRSVIEVIGDPLIHILRNSADHGVEMPEDRVKAGKPAQGLVTISARHEENHIVIEIVDDGKGIDSSRIRDKAVKQGLLSKEAAERLSEKEALQLIFHSGLSTAEQVTDVSGRGVGMDIVRSNIQKLGGIIDLETVIGEGTKFQLRLPLTLAIIRGLLVKVDGTVYVVPLGSVIETLLLDESQVQQVHKREVIVLRGMTTPLIRLDKLFGAVNTSDQTRDPAYVVIVGIAEQRIGLVVSSLVGEQEVVIKSLSPICGETRGVSGATILGNGNVALILDVSNLVHSEAA